MAVGYESHGKVVEELYKLRERVGITRAKVAECEALRHLPAVEAQFKVYPSEDERTAAAYALITCLVNTAHHMSESQQMVLRYGLRIGPIRDCSATSYQKRLDLALDEEPAIGGRKNFSEGSYAEYVANCFEHLAQVLIQVAESPCDGKLNVDDAALRKQQHLDDIIRSSFDIEAIAQGRKAAASWIRQGGPDGLERTLDEYFEKVREAFPAGISYFSFISDDPDRVAGYITKRILEVEYEDWARVVMHKLPLVHKDLWRHCVIPMSRTLRGASSHIYSLAGCPGYPSIHQTYPETSIISTRSVRNGR